MKKTILLSSIFAAGAVLAATDVDSSVIGTLPVTVVKDQQLMAVPFADADGEISVNDMVKTSDLTEGDKLYVANGNGYDMWKLEGGQWKSANKVTIKADGSVDEGVSLSAENAKVKRGDAFWLETANGGNVMLLGGKSNADSSVAVAGKWNLIGNPGIEDKTLAATGFVNGDKVSILQENGYLKTWTFKTSQNGWWVRGSDARTITVPAGKGIWFYANGSEDRQVW